MKTEKWMVGVKEVGGFLGDAPAGVCAVMFPGIEGINKLAVRDGVCDAVEASGLHVEIMGPVNSSWAYGKTTISFDADGRAPIEVAGGPIEVAGWRFANAKGTEAEVKEIARMVALMEPEVRTLATIYRTDREPPVDSGVEYVIKDEEG